MTLLAADGEGSWYFAIFLGLSFLICEWRGVNQLSSKTHCSAILSFFFFEVIGVQLLYNVALVSGAQ